MRVATTILAAASLLACTAPSPAPPAPPAVPADVPVDAGVSGPPDPAPPDAGPPDSPPDGGAKGWVVLHEETFEALQLPAPDWQADPVPDDGPFSDQGLYFSRQGVKAPAAH